VKIELEKKAGGASVLRCTRRDGSITYERHEGRQGTFYPVHDLTHFAVESELSRSEGFFGLVASGWEIEETTGKSPRGPIPEGAMAVERLVGLLDLERGGAARWEPADLGLTSDEADRVRRRLAELLTRWVALPVGGTLTVDFDR
jgi:hypothetical protein